MIRPRFLILLALWLGVIQGTAQGIPARFSIGDILIVDEDADPPPETFQQRGAVFTMNPAVTEEVTTVVSPFSYSEPVRAIVGRNKLIYVADSDADPLRLQQRNGAVFIMDSRNGRTAGPVHTVASRKFLEPVDVLLDEDERILILDAQTNVLTVGSSIGALFRYDRSTENLEVLATSQLFVEPRRMVYDVDGAILILDVRADPMGFGNEPGAVFRVDPDHFTVSPLFSLPGFTRLESLTLDPDGNYLLVDRDADPFGLGGRPGGVFRIDRNTLQFDGVVASDTAFTDPLDALFDDEGNFYLLDLNARVLGTPAGRGAVYRVDPQSGEVLEYWANELFRSVKSISLTRGADMDSSKIIFTDLNGGIVTYGDLLQFQIQLRNTGGMTTGPVSLVDRLTVGLTPVGGTLEATAGEVLYNPGGPTVEWTGVLEPGAAERISFIGVVDEEANLAVGQNITAVSPAVSASFSWLSQVQFAFSPGAIVLGDPSGIYTISEGTSNLVLLTQDPDLETPSGMAFSPDGELIIADGRARIVQNQPGAIFEFSRQTNDIRVLAAGDPLVQPNGVALSSDGTIYIAAVGVVLPGPFNIPGGIFRLEGAGVVPDTVIVGDPLNHPVRLLFDESDRLFVVDFDADPAGTGENRGAVFQIDPDVGTVVHTYTHPEFVDPVGITKLSDSRLIITDQAANPLNHDGDTGALFEIDLNTDSVSVFLADTNFVNPSDVVQDSLGNLYIADTAADPGGFGFYHGVVFKYDPQPDSLWIAVLNTTLQGPRSFAVRKLGDFRTSTITGGDKDGPPFYLGDTLFIEATLVNTGLANAPGVVAEFDGSPALDVLEFSSDQGIMGPLPGTNQVKWVGKIDRGDSVKVEALYTVLPDGNGQEASFWEPVEVTLDIQAPFAPNGETVATRLIAPLARGSHVVVDQDADPLELPGEEGSLFLLDPKRQGARLLFSDEALDEPVAAVLDANEDIIILDSQANAGAYPDAQGTIFRLSVQTGELEPIFWSDSLVGAVDLVPEPDGTYLLVDEATRITGFPFQRGAVFRLEAPEGPMSLVSADSSFRLPTSVVRALDGSLYVSDYLANPLSLPGNNGCVWRVDPATGSVTDTIQIVDFNDPSDLDVLLDGRILITDASANPEHLPEETGALFALDTETKDVEVFATSPLFVRPHRSVLAPDGRILVVDRRAVHPAGGRGAILSVNPQSGEVTYFAGSEQFEEINNLMVLPFPAVRVSAFNWLDLDGAPLDGGDRIAYRVELANIGKLDEASAAFVDTIPSELTLLPETVIADAGVVEVDGRVLRWSGPVAMGERVILTYDVLVDFVAAEGARIERRVYVSGEFAEPLATTLEHVVATTIDPGAMYMVDYDADPLGIGLQPGAVFKVSLPLGNITTIASVPEFATPVDIELLSESDRTLLLLDADADPDGTGERPGGLFIVDAGDGSVEPLATDTTWVEPTQILKVSDGQVLVLDSAANPFGFATLGPGPGAVYSVSLPGGEVEIVYSDTVFVVPLGMALDGKGGLYIADERADPLGTGMGGAIFRIDLSSGDIETVASDTAFADPFRVEVLPDGDLLVLDRTTRFGRESGDLRRGAVLRIADFGRGGVRVHSLGDAFRNPRDLFIDGNASVFVVDRDADPTGFGNAPGAVFRFSPVTRTYEPLAATDGFRNPSGAFIHDALTPVRLERLEAVPTDDGAVLVVWEVSSDVDLEGYYVLRGPAGAQEDLVILNPEHPVTGDGPLTFLDVTPNPGEAYDYVVVAQESGGASRILGRVGVVMPPSKLRFALEMPSPNPSRGSTALRYAVPARQTVELAIYDVRGRLVKRLARGIHEPGVYDLVWDGRSRRSHRVASGIYFARLDNGRQSRVRRLVILR